MSLALRRFSPFYQKKNLDRENNQYQNPKSTSCTKLPREIPSLVRPTNIIVHRYDCLGWFLFKGWRSLHDSCLLKEKRQSARRNSRWAPMADLKNTSVVSLFLNVFMYRTIMVIKLCVVSTFSQWICLISVGSHLANIMSPCIMFCSVERNTISYIYSSYPRASACIGPHNLFEPFLTC